MTLRPRWTLGGILCAALLVLLVAPALAAGPESTEAAHEGGGLINVDKPLLAKMEERTAAIKKSLEEAQAARADAARQQEENVGRLRAAHQEAASIREQALKEAADEQRRLVEAARGEAQRLVEAART